MTTEVLPRANIAPTSPPMRKPALRIAGFTGTFDDMNKAQIPQLWGRLMGVLPLPGQVGAESFGVCAAASEPGTMRYAAGVAIAADAPVPEGMEVFDLPPQAYLVFRQTLDGGDLHAQMQAGAKEIWGERVPKSEHRLAQAPDLEFYPADFRPDHPGAWLEWWVPVEA